MISELKETPLVDAGATATGVTVEDEWPSVPEIRHRKLSVGSQVADEPRSVEMHSAAEEPPNTTDLSDPIADCTGMGDPVIGSPQPPDYPQGAYLVCGEDTEAGDWHPVNACEEMPQGKRQIVRNRHSGLCFICATHATGNHRCKPVAQCAACPGTLQASACIPGSPCAAR